MNSIAIVYANDAEGTDLECRHFEWQHITFLQDARQVVLINVYWDQGASSPNKNTFSRHECYRIARDPGTGGGVEVTWCDANTAGPAAARDTSFGNDGQTARINNWPSKLAQAAMRGPVGLFGFPYDHPNIDSIVTAADALADATPITDPTGAP